MRRTCSGERTGASLSAALAELGRTGRTALIPYCMGGYPSFEESLRLIAGAAEAGADAIEIGIPFSDPLADGPTIQAASQASLDNGFTPSLAIDLVCDVRKSTRVPLVFMTYFNVVLHYGLERFVADASEAGVDGVIVPDLPMEEAGSWRLAAGGKLETIYLIAPTSTDSRIEAVVREGEGFIYAVSTTGVTGARGELPQDLGDFIGRIRVKTDKPICVGFGVSTPDQAKAVSRLANGVIVGSALIDAVRAGGVEAGVDFVRELRRALDAGEVDAP
ncbi:MAG: tryptophan synthase subunit alpha [Actinobacteria bacterium]|nr:MAG: tryptophan synthase subunit alpha [Actinomycetota bacterium]